MKEKRSMRRLIVRLGLAIAILAFILFSFFPGVIALVYCFDGCDSREGVFLFIFTKSIPQWTPDDASIVFEHRGKIYVVEADGSRLRTISEGSGERDIDFSPDVSPGGDRIAYATLRYRTGFLWNADHNHEIVTSALDGSDKRRLTENKADDTHPVWSPDGKLIAFLSGKSEGAHRIYTMSPDGSQVRQITSSVHAKDQPPVWSPDGSRIAFIAYGEEEEIEVIDDHRYSSVIYTVGADGSNLTKLGNSMSPPAWSPDGSRVAFIRRDAGSNYGKLTTMNPDGTEPREVILLEGDTVGGPDYKGNVSWSPDGSEIQFRSFVIRTDGSELRRLPGSRNGWSPDGSRIATSNVVPGIERIGDEILEGDMGDSTSFLHSDLSSSRYDSGYFVLHTVARDGSDRRALVVQNYDGSLLAAHRSSAGELTP